MPYALRGTDLILYNVLLSLGLRPQVRPVLDPQDYEQVQRYEYFKGRAACQEDRDAIAETAELWLYLEQDTITDSQLEAFVNAYPTCEQWLERTAMAVAGTSFHVLKYERMRKADLETEDCKSKVCHLVAPLSWLLAIFLLRICVLRADSASHSLDSALQLGLDWTAYGLVAQRT